MKLLRFFRRQKYSPHKYNPLITINIHRDNLLHNLKEYQQANPRLTIAPVLKSNAYGHGLTLVGKILDKHKLPFFVVDSLFEVLVLRSEAIKSNLLVIGYTRTESICKSPQTGTAFTITSFEQLKELAKDLKFKQDFHLKIDTGMHRQGIMPAEINEAIKSIKSNDNLQLTGLCSHLADADNEISLLTPRQMQRWQQSVEIFKGAFPGVKFFHLANSAALSAQLNTGANVARLGLGLYGIGPSKQNKLKLRPVLSMHSIITSINHVAPGESVGYNATFTAKQSRRLATVPIGYYEGLDRRLSNKGWFIIDQQPCPIRGRISMNITTIDVSQVPGATMGTPVNIISEQIGAPNSIEVMARQINEIPYVLLVHLPAHLRRIVV